MEVRGHHSRPRANHWVLCTSAERIFIFGFTRPGSVGKCRTVCGTLLCLTAMALFGIARSARRFSTPLLVQQRASAFSTSTRLEKKLKVAVIGQSLFGLEVYKELMKNGHKVVGVFTVPDVNGKPDPLGEKSEKDGIPTFKFKAWRSKATGGVIPSVMDKYQALGAELNVLPFCSQFIPMDVINKPEHKSIIYHPSILPRHRGASAINW